MIYSNPELCKEQKGQFLLSKALEQQTTANHLLNRNSSLFIQSHKKALELFQYYINCATIQKYTVSPMTFYLKASSHFELKEWNEANNELESALKNKPQLKEALLLKTRLLQKQDRLEEANQMLEEAISDYSEDSEMLYYLGNVNFDLQNFPKAVLYFTSLYHLINKKEGETRYKAIVLKLLGDIYFRRSDLNKAIHYYTLYLQTKENDLDVVYTLAQLYFLSGKLEESKMNLSKILKFNPDSKPVIQLLAEMQFLEYKSNSLKYFDTLNKEGKIKEDNILSGIYKLLSDRIKESEDFFTQFLIKNPNRLSARIALGMIYSKQGNQKEYLEQLKLTSEIAMSNKLYFIALEQLNEILELANKNSNLEINKPDILEKIAYCQEENGNPFLGINSLRKSIELSNNEKDKKSYYIRLASLYRNSKVKKFDESNKILFEQFNQNDMNSNILFMVGLNYFSMEKYKESILYFTRAIEKNPNNSNIYFYRASSYEKEKLIPQTISDLKKSIELDPTNPINYNYLGYLYTENEIELVEAEKYIKRAIELEPDNSAYQDSLGWIYYKMGKFKQALHHINLAQQILLDKKEEDSVVYDHLGDIYFRLKDYDNAIESWKRSSDLNKTKEAKEKINSKIKNANQLKSF
jgi:tetratricopeptide (TPR) repeat protein